MVYCKIQPKIKTKISQKIMFKLRTSLLALFVLLIPLSSQARTFDPNNIITDEELLAKDSLSQAAIQAFLTRENSVLAAYSQTVEGKAMTAAEMIWQVSQKHGVNPKFLLTTLEKEQSLIHKSTATAKALDWATGYGCYGGGCKEKYQGFYNQIEAAVETQQIYWEKAGQLNFKVGQTTDSFDNFPVTPANRATANLYIYTPYVGYSPELGVLAPYGGNRLFWQIWHRYFSHQKFLDGQVITDGANYWLIQNNQKRKFASRELFLADYAQADAIFASAADLAAFPDGIGVYFKNNSLVRSSASGQIFLLEDAKKRPLVEDSALALLSDFRLAVAAGEISSVSENQLSPYSLGSNISNASVYPQGKLLKDETGKIWQVKDNLKREVDPAIWQNRFNNKIAAPVSAADLEKYPTGSPVLLKDGVFAAVNDKYYVISNGERVRIEDLGIFDRLFGADKKINALKITAALLEAHPPGNNIDYADNTIKDAMVNTPAAEPATNYGASFNSLSPEGVMMTGETKELTVKFKNTGTISWPAGDIWLKITDKDKITSSFAAAEKINFTESNVASGELATFVFKLTAPTNQTGLLSQEFTLYRNNEKISSAGKFIIVKPGVSGQILEHNIPVAVKNTWKPVAIALKIKNTSADTSWLSRRSALEIYNADGKASPFYDKNDWVRIEVAGVPLNKSTIKPGETGEFKFTLDPRGLKKGLYTVKIQLKLLDKGKTVYLDGKESWNLEIRVD
ncbi:MAG: hypothetical protein A3J65_02350 [Candidatus Buchananbacteria bacterium RIFCSPHIGHO2_02_FULL_45_11b]|uniref:Uncharacterized protein n=2 Tax=Candidatus Buchananiibacteriota TaxID=1817903 RepID=A0A1G1YKD1_9BACT|nr:MAG: hypothetical protein A3J65_02350 [Candidatus Buchananbacteria bacterium RIFCSPHIGHO2_02_FULL_45_11b]OGY52805.1 MAG: hypothetical protein A3B15_01510 [Candidatus Buchananbacteria bacterium RIFCSPLOWO2_01_FULL_45_31]